MPRHILIKPTKVKYKEKNIKGKGKLTNNIQLSKTEPGRNIEYEID